MKGLQDGVWVLLASLAAVGAVQAQQASSLCERLAHEARRLPASAWAGGAQPLERLLRIERRPATRPRSALEDQLLSDPALSEALSAGAGDPLGIERLAGTDVYRLYSIQGTAHCESSLFIEAALGKAARRLAAPPTEAVPCWTQAGDFGHVFGQAAFVTHGSAGAVRFEQQLQIAPWTGRGWGQACTLNLAFRKTLRLGGRFCPAALAPCESGGAAAVKIAAAYEADREGEAPLGPLDFAAGRRPGGELLAAVQRVDARNPPEFPTFGADARRLDVFDTRYANVDVRRLALWLDGRWWLGVVGRAGVGWREGSVTLLSIFELRGDGELRPVASYQLEHVNGGLLKAVAAD